MANFITMSRIFLAIIAIGILFIHTTPMYIAAFFLTAIVIWFDGLDGFVARLLKEDSRFGAMLDILGDRIVENVYWIAFCALGFVQVWIPIVVVTRGLLTDGVRSLAFERGYTAFGTTTMQQNPIAKFIVASRTVRFSYAVVKALAFALLISTNLTFLNPHTLALIVVLILSLSWKL